MTPVAARLVRIVHESAKALEVALLEKRRALDDALVFADRVNRPLRRGLGKAAAVKNPLCHRDIAEVRDGLPEDAREELRRILARLAARRIRTVNERMLCVGLDHHERDAVAHRDGLELVRAEVALDERARLAVHRGGLVEKAARAAGERMLGLLADLRELRLAERRSRDRNHLLL